MSMSYRPRLTKEQISDLKADTKYLASAISKELALLRNYVKFPVVATQNSVAKQFSFSSFSELASKEVPVEHHADFNLTDALNMNQLHLAFSTVKVNAHQDLSEIVSRKIVWKAVTKLEESRSQPSEPSISLEDFYEILNASEFGSGHQYTVGDGFPSSADVDTKTEFFCELSDWDHFRVYDGSDYKCYTVEKFDYMYDPKVKLFRVTVGRWYENGFCVGQK